MKTQNSEGTKECYTLSLNQNYPTLYLSKFYLSIFVFEIL